MDDFLILDINGHLEASKRKSYRQEVRNMFQTFVGFLQDNNLTNSCLVPEGKQTPDDLKVYRSDLTDLGYEVVQRKFHEWLRCVSDGKVSSKDCSMLEQELQAVIKEQEQ